MNDMIIEATGSKDDVLKRADYYSQLGYAVDTRSCKYVTWINNGKSDTAHNSDLVWIVVATK